MVCVTLKSSDSQMSNQTTYKTVISYKSNSQPLHTFTPQKPVEGKYKKATNTPLSRKSLSVTDLRNNKTNETKTKIPDSPSSHLRLVVESTVFGQKLQMNLELLFLASSNELWPISLHHLNKVERDFHKFSDCYEELLLLLKVLKLKIDETENKTVKCEYVEQSDIDSKIMCLNELVNSSIILMELTYQTVYCISSTRSTWKDPPVALLNRKTIISAIDEVELCCLRIREVMLQTSYTADDNIPKEELESLMLFSCNKLSSALTYLAMCCRTAAANVEMYHSKHSADVKHKHSQNYESHFESGQLQSKTNLFHLAMQGVSKSSQCLLTSVKNYVEDRNPENRFITERFAENVSTSIKAFAAIATSSKFVKHPALIPTSIKDTKTKIFGACMNLISPTIEFLFTIPSVYSTGNEPIPIPTPHTRSLAYTFSTRTNENSQKRAENCLTTMKEALSQLQQTLSLYQNY